MHELTSKFALPYLEKSESVVVERQPRCHLILLFLGLEYQFNDHFFISQILIYIKTFNRFIICKNNFCVNFISNEKYNSSAISVSI